MKLRGAFDTGDTIISGSLVISGSAPTELTIFGNQVITGSLVVSGAVGDDLIVFGMQRVHGTLVISSSTGTDLTVIGDAVITGSLSISGSGNTRIDNALFIPLITSSAPGQNSITTIPLSDIPGLNLPVNNGTYLVDTWIYGQSSNAAGVGFALSSSATVTSIDVIHTGLSTGVLLASSSRITTNNFSGSAVMWAVANTEAWAHLTGKLVTSTNGNIFVRTATKASGAGVSIRSGSYLSVTRLA